MSAVSLCPSFCQNAKAATLKTAFSSGSPRSMATAARLPRRLVTRRTHFLNLPLYEAPLVVSKLGELRQLWREGAASANLEPGIIIPSLHQALSIKLGNINIKGVESTTVTEAFNPDAPESQKEPPPAFEREEVLKVLGELKDPIRQLLASHGEDGVLRIPLADLTPLMHGHPMTFNPRRVNVLFLRPAQGKHFEILTALMQLVHERFMAAGMFAGSPVNPAKPNVTLINTANRESYVPAPGRTRKPFNLAALYKLDGFKAFRPEELPNDLSLPLSIDLGVAEVRGLKLDRVLPGKPTSDSTAPSDGELTFA